MNDVLSFSEIRSLKRQPRELLASPLSPPGWMRHPGLTSPAWGCSPSSGLCPTSITHRPATDAMYAALLFDPFFCSFFPQKPQAARLPYHQNQAARPGRAEPAGTLPAVPRAHRSRRPQPSLFLIHLKERIASFRLPWAFTLRNVETIDQLPAVWLNFSCGIQQTASLSAGLHLLRLKGSSR